MKARGLVAAVGVLVASVAHAESAAFLFFWGAVPVGRVTLEYDGATRLFRYRSEHFFAKAAPKARTRFNRTLTFPASPTAGAAERIPEALWLWRRPPASPRCTEGFDERTDQQGALCVTLSEGAEVRGTDLGEPFVAHYRRGRLVSLELGPVRFDATTTRGPMAPADVFEPGLPVEGGAGPLSLQPLPASLAPPEAPCAPLVPWTEKAARALAQSMGRTEELEVSGCVRRARAYVAAAREAGGSARLVYGLVREGRLAFPHAWVSVATPAGLLTLDPSREGPVTAQDHLAFAGCDDARGAAFAGALYRELYLGRVHVVRAGATPSLSRPGKADR